MVVSEILSRIRDWIKTGIPFNVKSSNVRTLLTWMTIRMDVQEKGRLKIVKSAGNTATEQEVGDIVSGIIEDEYVENGVYLGGNISLLSSYEITPPLTSVEWTDIEGSQSSIPLSGFNNDLPDPQISDVIGLDDALDDKVDKVTGKGLSDENYTLGEKQKLAGLEGSKWLGLYPNITALESAHPTALAGNYADVDAGVGSDTIRYVWDVSDDKFVQSGSGAALTPAQIKQMYESNPDTNVFTDDEKSKLASITAIFTTALKNAYDGAVTWISTNGQNLLDHLGLTDNPHSVTLDQVLEEDNVSARNATFGEVTATKFIDSDGTETLTGTVIDLSNNIDGTIYNESTPSAANSFSATNLKVGGFATNYIDTTEKTDFPTVTNTSGSVIPTQSDAFRADAEFLMVLDTDGTDVEVFYVDYLNLDPPPSGGGGSWNDITDKPTEFPPSPHTHVASDITDLQSAVSNNSAVVANTAKVSNINADWESISGGSQILNKPTRVNFNIYNQTKNNSVTVSNTVRTSVVSLTTGSKIIPSGAKDSSYIGKVFGTFSAGGTSRDITIGFRVGSREPTLIVDNADSTAVNFSIDYTINYTGLRIPHISGVVFIGGKTFVIDLEPLVSSNDEFDIFVTLTGGSLTVNSSYLHRNHNS